jgi:hypothetical protein
MAGGLPKLPVLNMHFFIDVADRVADMGWEEVLPWAEGIAQLAEYLPST